AYDGENSRAAARYERHPRQRNNHRFARGNRQSGRWKALAAIMKFVTERPKSKRFPWTAISRSNHHYKRLGEPRQWLLRQKLESSKTFAAIPLQTKYDNSTHNKSD